MALHADLDGPPADPQLWAELDPLRVASGSDGHEHGLVMLAEPLTDLNRWYQLQRALRDALGGGADAKIADNDVLRLPGTINGKPAAPRAGEPPADPTPVTPLGWGGRVWSVPELAALLRVDLTQPPPPLRTARVSSNTVAPATVPVPAVLTPNVQAAVDGFAAAPDKSTQWQRLVGCSLAAGYSRDEAYAITVTHGLPHIPRYVGREVAMFETSWTKSLAWQADHDTYGLTEADVRDRLAAGATPGELHAELVAIDGPGLVNRLGVRALLSVVPGPSPAPAHDPPADDDPREAGEPAAAGWVLDVSAPTLDPPRAEVFGPWVAVQLARHLTATRQGRETAVSVTDRVREQWGACAPLWCRGCAIAGLAYYPESNLDAAEVCEAFVAAAVESGAEGLAELTTEQLAAAFRSGWDTGLTEPMLPMAGDDPARPARGRGKRGVLPDAAAMRAAVRKATVDGESAESPVEVLVEFAREHWVFGNDGAGMLYAVPTSGPRLVVRVGERSSFRRRLTQRVYEERHRSFRGDSYSVALEVLRSVAEQAEPVPVRLRVARWRDGVVLDLGGTDARLVEVTAGGWWIIDAGTEHPLFRRSGHTTALPEPVRGGDLGVLAALLGYEPDSPEFLLVVGWLVTTLLAPDADRPALWWTGPEGAGKTMRSGLVTAVLDPRGTSERATGGGQLGRSAEDILVAAASRYIVTFDNLTSISTRQSDLLCGVVTGTVQEGRQRFTDDEVVVVAVQRAMSITSRRLPTGVGSDLLDRLIVLGGDRMLDRQRRTPAALWAEFEREHGAILGALLDLAVRVLARRDQVEREVTGLPRMATHGLILATLDAITGAGYLDAYTAAVEDVKGEQAECDPLIGAVIDAVERNNGSWIGPAGDLLELLARPEDQADPWPANGRVLSQRLRAAAELLRAAGITFDVKKSNSVRNVYLSIIAEDAP